jgi:3-oxoadipate enol-lactonase
VELYTEVAGEGPEVAFVHAGISDSRMWEPQWAEYASSFRVLRCDLRGFGRTPLEAGTFSSAQDLVDVLEGHGFENAALVGNSLGGRVVLEVAVARPDLVRALVLVAPGMPGHDWSEETRAGWAEEEAALEAGDLDEAVEVNLRMWVDGPRRTTGDVDPQVSTLVAEMQRRAFELQLPIGNDADEEPLAPDFAERLGEINVPTLIVIGEEDLPDMHAISKRVESEIPGARRVTIPDTAHVPSLERPREFDELVFPFLKETVS